MDLPNWISLALVMVVAGCSAPDSASQRRSSPGSRDSEDSTETPATTDGPAGRSPADEPGGTGPLGLVTIDVQKVFFDTATRRNPSGTAGRMERTSRLWQLAATKDIPIFVTYEDSKTGDHGLPPTLAAALPPKAQELIKTTFAATGQPQFTPAIKASGARRLLVIGAETDVCVLQTILGLRREGFQVLAVTDGLFTEEVNDGPAHRRMRQAGVVEIPMNDAEALLASGGPSPSPPAATTPVIVRPLEIGIVLHALEGLSAPDANAAAKTARMKELLLVSEWFRIPLFAADPTKALAQLPASLRSLVTRPVTPLAQLPATVKQLAIAGGRGALDAAASGLAGKDVFLVEDALFGTEDLEPLYGKGAVPTTYKTLYYEMIQSVADSQWPSPQWVTDGSKYFNLTMAPEQLPPLNAR